ncbi:membrane bound O-acyl transferase family-domain-containing protein [Dichomitus squalens]|uniref:Membrane bound O-acyl transferase family-domain-containing protein n=1 Tax=Dichomitus squalens TaxID=114155 RepID=A0A4V2JZB0_9APHY|nr:membrane bound O-acyl transferase family-domain-containing protein [Dichomitus squalens]
MPYLSSAIGTRQIRRSTYLRYGTEAWHNFVPPYPNPIKWCHQYCEVELGSQHWRDTRVPFSGPAHLLLPELILTLLVALNIPRAAKLAGSVALLGFIIHTFATTTSGESVDEDTLRGATLGNTFFSVIYLIWFNDPMRDFQYLGEEDKSPLALRPIWSRSYATLCLLRNNRMIGWNVQVSNVPPVKGARAQFLLRRTRQLLVAYALADVSESLVRLNRPLYASTSPGGSQFSPGVIGHLQKSCCMAIWLFMTYSVLKLYYVFSSIVAVALYASRPEDWPDAFGSWKDAYTVRRLWGRTWHQFFRRYFQQFGSVAVDTLRIPRGTFLSSQVQVYVAFAVSGLLHSFGDLANAQTTRAGSFLYFLYNGLAITFEDVVIKLAKAFGFTGPTTTTRWLGYAWVVLWVSLSTPVYVDWMYESGMSSKTVLPYSPVREVLLPWIRSAYLTSKA